MPMLIYPRVKLGLRPDVNALATLIILIVAIGVCAADRILSRQERQRTRDMQIAESEKYEFSDTAEDQS